MDCYRFSCHLNASLHPYSCCIKQGWVPPLFSLLHMFSSIVGQDSVFPRSNESSHTEAHNVTNESLNSAASGRLLSVTCYILQMEQMRAQTEKWTRCHTCVHVTCSYCLHSLFVSVTPHFFAILMCLHVWYVIISVMTHTFSLNMQNCLTFWHCISQCWFSQIIVSLH